MIQRRLAAYGGLRVRPGSAGRTLEGKGRAQMSPAWETIESGPAEAGRTVLLIPGGLMSARSYAELMAQPALAGVRLVAVTLPGHAGAPPPEDFSIETCARLAAARAAGLGCDAVVGFSLGATVALEMAVSGAFRGPVVLLGISLSPRDEPAFLRALNRLGVVLGRLPWALMLKLIGLAAKQARVSPDRRAQLLADFRRNDPRIMRPGFRAYLDTSGATMRRRRDCATRGCRPGSCTRKRAMARSPARSGARSRPAPGPPWSPSPAPASSSRTTNLSASPASSSRLLATPPSTRTGRRPRRDCAGVTPGTVRIILVVYFPERSL
jgi:pimeloyl-ACP methyl ester carboxylesterase